MTQTIHEPAWDVPVAAEVDLCVVGGSCTGLFAAVRAARLGLRVALVEELNKFGGMATAAMVSIWHSTLNTTNERQIIAGLSLEVIDRLRPRDAVVEYVPDSSKQFVLNPAELTCQLDLLLGEHEGVRPFLRARCVAAVGDGETLSAIVIEDRNGRRAIRAKAFIDATGDAVLIHQAGGATARREVLQPPTTAGVIEGLNRLGAQVPGFNLRREITDPSEPDAVPGGFPWHSELPGSEELRSCFITRVHGRNCSDADDLTAAEIEGRDQLRRIVSILRRKHPELPVTLVALAGSIGVRDGRYARCLHTLREQEVLEGVRFDDAVANGTYRVDVHHQGAGGITFRYLNGTETVHDAQGKVTKGRWRDARGEDPTFYQVPYRSLVPAEGPANVLVAGRCLDADVGAFGGVRVMINCNQTGEAAGVAAVQIARENRPAAEVDAGRLRDMLADGGSIVI